MDYREKIKDCNTLDDLFFLWKKEHEREPEVREAHSRGKTVLPPTMSPSRIAFVQME
jgi:hypothetical protein